jgi:cytochrome c553
MTDITYVQQLRKTISGEFYFGAMCRETKRRIAISTDTSRGKQRYSQSGETIVSCNHCHKITGSTTATYSLFRKSDGNERFYFVDVRKR